MEWLFYIYILYNAEVKTVKVETTHSQEVGSRLKAQNAQHVLPHLFHSL